MAAENLTSFSVQISDFISTTKGLSVKFLNANTFEIFQAIDKKKIVLSVDKIEIILPRKDLDGSTFLQVNFTTGEKILLTPHLIGFQPARVAGADTSKLPRVVTTPDLVSIFETLQEAVHAEALDSDVELLRRIFDSVILGGEKVGFDLTRERVWLSKLVLSNPNASA